MSESPVAVIDIGSNSIKLLVARRGSGGAPREVAHRTIDSRISAGIGGDNPRLTTAGIASGLEAIEKLLSECAAHAPVRTVLAATSAVRGASNGTEFCEKVRERTGLNVRILSGDEEAALIGRGLLCDPSLSGLRDFYVFDLGGGSLECLAFRDRAVLLAESLPLGCVRLTEAFLPDPSLPFPHAAQASVTEFVRAALGASAFTFALPPRTTAVGSGGTLTTARAIMAAREGRRFEETDTDVTTTQLHFMLGWIGALPLAERSRIPGLPPARADVFPVALATVLAVAEAGGFGAFRNSLYNLRWGLAAEALD